MRRGAVVTGRWQASAGLAALLLGGTVVSNGSLHGQVSFSQLHRAASNASNEEPSVLPAEVTLGLADESNAVAAAPDNVLVNDPNLDLTARDTQSGTALVLGAGSVIIVGYNDSGSFTGSNNQFTGWARSTNGGLSFTDMGKLPASANGDLGFPVLARDTSSGTIYFVTLMFSGSGVQVFRSTDNGSTFTAPVNGVPGVSGSQDKPWVAVDNFAGAGQGTVYLVCRDFGPGNGIKITRSTDGGATWGGGAIVASGAAGNVQGAFVNVGDDHAVYVFWFDQTAAPQTIKVRRSTDQGATFSTATTAATLNGSAINGDLSLNGGFRSNSFPQAAVNPANGNLYLVYNTCSSTPCSSSVDHGNIRFTQSTDKGATWSAPLTVNTDATTRDQFFPTIAVTPDGSHLLVSWYDRRNSPTNTLIDRFGRIGAISGGTVTFAPDFPITTSSFPVVIGQDPSVNSVFMGDYDMAAADNSTFYVTWGDNRLANPNFPSHVNQPDVRFAKFDLNGQPIVPAECGPHTVHGHLPGPSDHTGVDHNHHGQHGHTVESGCPPHAPGHTPG